MLQPYPKETFPDNIIFVKDTSENRMLLSNCKTVSCKFWSDDYSYLKINLEKRLCQSSLSFEWLYRNQPLLTSIEEALTKLN
jgi:hypothetical protein